MVSVFVTLALIVVSTLASTTDKMMQFFGHGWCINDDNIEIGHYTNKPNVFLDSTDQCSNLCLEKEPCIGVSYFTPCSLFVSAGDTINDLGSDWTLHGREGTGPITGVHSTVGGYQKCYKKSGNQLVLMGRGFCTGPNTELGRYYGHTHEESSCAAECQNRDVCIGYLWGVSCYLYNNPDTTISGVDDWTHSPRTGTGPITDTIESSSNARSCLIKKSDTSVLLNPISAEMNGNGEVVDASNCIDYTATDASSQYCHAIGAGRNAKQWFDFIIPSSTVARIEIDQWNHGAQSVHDRIIGTKIYAGDVLCGVATNAMTQTFSCKANTDTTRVRVIRDFSMTVNDCCLHLQEIRIYDGEGYMITPTSAAQHPSENAPDKPASNCIAGTSSSSDYCHATGMGSGELWIKVNLEPHSSVDYITVSQWNHGSQSVHDRITGSKVYADDTLCGTMTNEMEQRFNCPSGTTASSVSIVKDYAGESSSCCLHAHSIKVYGARPFPATTSNPTMTPSFHPSFTPTSTPTLTPSAHPTMTPSFHPSFTPTCTPTLTPTSTSTHAELKLMVKNAFNHVKSTDEFKKGTDKFVLPALIRKAFHDAGHFDKNSGEMRMGCIQHFLTGDAACEQHGNLEHADRFVNAVMEIVMQSFTHFSSADAVQLLGALAVDQLAQGTNAPSLYDRIRTGRTDPQRSTCIDGKQMCENLPRFFSGHSDTMEGLKKVWEEEIDGKMIGINSFSKRDAVALIGAHTVGRHHTFGAWVTQPMKFDNEYFLQLKRVKNIFDNEGQIGKNPNHPFGQSFGTWFRDSEEVKDSTFPKGFFGGRNIMMLESDMALVINAPELIEEYAANQMKWREDFNDAYVRMSELGVSDGLEPHVSDNAGRRLLIRAEKELDEDYEFFQNLQILREQQTVKIHAALQKY